MATSWDLFFSYRRHDLGRARPLLQALAELGVRVWRDENDIPDQASITREIRGGIAHSKALLAFYSSTYPLSNPCQQELTTAWLAAQQIDQTTDSRIWIVNPERDFDHIPELLRDRQIPRLTGDGSRIHALAQKIRDRLDSLPAASLGSRVRDLPESAYHGMRPVQARRFAGRAKEFWICMENSPRIVSASSAACTARLWRRSAAWAATESLCSPVNTAFGLVRHTRAAFSG